MTNLIQEFVEWLRKEGYEVAGGNFMFGFRHTNGSPVEMTPHFRDTDEEQPELLLWCLKELDARHPDGISLIREILVSAERVTHKGGWEVIEGPYGADAGETLGFGPTMTAAALSGLVKG